MLVGENAQRGGTVLLIERSHILHPGLGVYPASRRALAFKLGNDAGGRGFQGLAHRGHRLVEHGLEAGGKLV